MDEFGRTHNTYPHTPGQLYGCDLCESQCYCGNETPPGDNPECCGLAAILPGACHTSCVHCEGQTTVKMTYRESDGQETTSYVPPF